MCVILDLCKTRGCGKKTWNGAPFLIFTGAPKVLSEFAPRGYLILDTPLICVYRGSAGPGAQGRPTQHAPPLFLQRHGT